MSAARRTASPRQTASRSGSRPRCGRPRSWRRNRILRDPAMVRDAQEAANARRVAEWQSCEDLRVGVLADDPYMLVLRDAARFPDGALGLYNRLLVPVGIVVVP